TWCVWRVAPKQSPSIEKGWPKSEPSAKLPATLINERVSFVRINRGWPICLALSVFTSARAAEPAQNSPTDPARQIREYRDFAMGRDGNAARGQELFNNEQRLACAKCHSVDGSSGKAGPDLLAAGDKFPRRELIRAVLEPSAEIAVGYGTTIVETKSGEEFQGILKQSTADALELIGADGKRVRI